MTTQAESTERPSAEPQPKESPEAPRPSSVSPGESLELYLRETARPALLTREGEMELAWEMVSSAQQMLEVLIRAGVRIPALDQVTEKLSAGPSALAGVAPEQCRSPENFDSFRCRLEADRALRREQLEQLRRGRRGQEAAAELARRRFEGLAPLELERRFLVELGQQLCREVETADATQRRRLEAQYDRPLPALQATRQELLELLAQFERAFSEMVSSNLRLVISTAKRYIGRGVALGDLVQEGNLGLLRAVDKFDPRLGYRFSTYATWWARQAVGRALAEHGRTIRVPVHVHEKLRKVRRAERNLQRDLQRPPTDEELGEASGLEPAVVRETLDSFSPVVSVNKPIGDEGKGDLLDLLQEESAATDASAQSLDYQRGVQRLLQKLSPRERWVVSQRFGLEHEDPQTLQEIGSELGLTRERVRQILAATLRKLRRAPEAEELASLFVD